MNLLPLVGQRISEKHPLANGLVGWWIVYPPHFPPPKFINMTTEDYRPVQHKEQPE